MIKLRYQYSLGIYNKNHKNKKDWDEDNMAFDKGVGHIIKMADTLTEGIIKHFPISYKAYK